MLASVLKQSNRVSGHLHDQELFLLNRVSRIAGASAITLCIGLTTILSPTSTAQSLEQITPLPESAIDLNAEIHVNTSDISAEQILGAQDEITTMYDSHDPYEYFDTLTDIEQRSIIAALKRDPSSLQQRQETRLAAQSDPYKIYISGLEMLSCINLVDVVSCGIANQAATKANNEAVARYPGDSLRNGKGDAFRHCSWNALMTIRIGSNGAERIATNHETIGDGPADENAMDLFNNAQGRQIGAGFINSKDETSALAICALWTNLGRLKTLK